MQQIHRPRTTAFQLSVLALGSLLFGAGGCDQPEQACPTAPPEAASISRICHAWASSGVAYGETDSLAAGRMPDGRVLVFASAKEADRLDVFDAATGRFLHSIGKKGDKPMEFGYPNGVLVLPAERCGNAAGDMPLLFVVDRDNARVQVLTADGKQCIGLIGKEDLHKPYGLAVSYQKDGVMLYITDTEQPYDEKIKCFLLEFAPGKVTGRMVRAFGEKTGAGQLQEVESIVADDRSGRLFVADEDASNVKVYHLDGTFTGKTLGDGFMAADVEGLALYDGPEQSFLIVTDQRKDMSVWHVFDRENLRWQAVFTGTPTVANTDGVCLYTGALPFDENGAFFAVHDDEDVRAYSLGDILELLPIEE